MKSNSRRGDILVMIIMLQLTLIDLGIGEGISEVSFFIAGLVSIIILLREILRRIQYQA